MFCILIVLLKRCDEIFVILDGWMDGWMIVMNHEC